MSKRSIYPHYQCSNVQSYIFHSHSFNFNAFMVNGRGIPYFFAGKLNLSVTMASGPSTSTSSTLGRITVKKGDLEFKFSDHQISPSVLGQVFRVCINLYMH